MKTMKLNPIAVALLLSFGAVPAFAQTNEELVKELKALRAQVDALEKKMQAIPAAPADGSTPQWGMTPEQEKDFNRLVVKSEALDDAQVANGFKALKFSGFMDPTYIYDKDQRRAGFQFINPVNNDAYSYDNGYFGTLALDFQKELEGGTKVRVTLMPNRGAGSAADPGGYSIVHEASFSIPLGDLQTRLIGGQIPDWSGYEVTQPTTNKLVTRGLLLDYTEPFTYTGAGMELVRGAWDMKAVLAIKDSTLQHVNRLTPVLAYRADYAKGEFSGFGFAGVEGRSPNANTGSDTWLDLLEVDGYFIRGDLTLQGQVGFGHQKQASYVAGADGSFRDARWWGLSTLAAYKLDPRFELVARADYILDSENGGGVLGLGGSFDGSGNAITQDTRDGFGASPFCTNGPACKGANRGALALGFNYALTSNTIVKAEYRYDMATQPVFFDVHDGTYKKNNSLLGTALVVSF